MSLARFGGGSSVHTKLEQIGEQDRLVTLRATATQAKRAAVHIARWAASFADEPLSTLTALVHGVAHQRAAPSQFGAESPVINGFDLDTAESESQLTMSR